MDAAILGFAGVVIGLAVGRGYGFWSGRRGELAEAVVAAAVLSEELRVLSRVGEAANGDRLQTAWHDHRRWMVIHMSPADYDRLGTSILSIAADPEPVDVGDQLKRMEALHRLFWQEHEAFILVPLIHYLKGDTVSKRIHEILAG